MDYFMHPCSKVRHTLIVFSREVGSGSREKINKALSLDGHFYERNAIQAWFDREKKTSPNTNKELSHTNLIPNGSLNYGQRMLGNKLHAREFKHQKQKVVIGCSVLNKMMCVTLAEVRQKI